jgi:hypothetical protein
MNISLGDILVSRQKIKGQHIVVVVESISELPYRSYGVKSFRDERRYNIGHSAINNTWDLVT